MTLAPEREPLEFQTIDDVLAALRRAGHRVTLPARTVLEALFAAPGPLAAEQIAPSLEPASVYRNLERLQQLGVVTHVHVGHGPGRYVLARGGEREYLVCERCGRITTVEPAQLDRVRELVRTAFGHEARFTHFPIHGRCAGCAAE
ncbi:Fur family transcriptional regulator [Candidatus Solirubrobacter pratensis]|uniref:Fur family transcriptional regulator n=1 Tax=Candidatus Solirubrobacter pratensis TaxID=1298857 RepID=UPI00041A6227|nr:transcriptional repressor [Candidatus Solirubrobacter pratensis]